MTGVTDDLAAEYDVLIVGTDISQSIIAGACSRVGITVLHIDANDYYGGASASFDLNKFVARIDGEESSSSVNESAFPVTETPDIVLNPHERLISIDNTANLTTFKNASVDWHDTTLELQEQLSKVSRKFSIDLTPKVLRARGDMVETLIRSGVSRYAEFVSVDQLFAFIEEKIFLVPCTRGQVFASSDVAPMDKRRLMKLITAALDEETHKVLLHEESSFKEYLTKEKFSSLLQDYVVNAITAVGPDASVKDGIASLRQFCHSVGRYGNSPYIACLYGSGELAQCFCRLCAVYGGVYVLRQTCASIVVDEKNNITAVVINGRLIRVKNVVLGDDEHSKMIVKAVTTTTTSVPPTETPHLQRAVVISDCQLRPHDREDDEKMKMSLMNANLGDNGALVSVLHGGFNAQLAPRGYCTLVWGDVKYGLADVTHIQSTGCSSAVSRLEPLVRSLFLDNIPKAQPKETTDEVVDEPKTPRAPGRLMTAFWDMDVGESSGSTWNVFVAPGSGTSIVDYGDMMGKLETYFATTFPDKQFLPEPIPFDELKEEHDREHEGTTTDEMSGLEPSTDKGHDVPGVDVGDEVLQGKEEQGNIDE